MLTHSSLEGGYMVVEMVAKADFPSFFYSFSDFVAVVEIP